MNPKVTITLEQEEYSALLDMAVADLRSPADELHHILRVEIDRRNSISAPKITSEVQNENEN